MNVSKNPYLEIADIGQLKSHNNSFNMPTILGYLNLNNSEIISILNIPKQYLSKVIKNKSYHPRKKRIIINLNLIIQIIVLIGLIIKIPTEKKEKNVFQKKISNWLRLPNPSYKMCSPLEMILGNNGFVVVSSLRDILESTPT